MGEGCAGNPHAADEVAGAEIGEPVGSTRARTGKPGTQTRPEPAGHRASPRPYNYSDAEPKRSLFALICATMIHTKAVPALAGSNPPPAGDRPRGPRRFRGSIRVANRAVSARGGK